MGVQQHTQKHGHHPLRAHQVEGSSPLRAGRRLWPPLLHRPLLLLLHSSRCLLWPQSCPPWPRLQALCPPHGPLKKPCKDPLAKVESLNLEVTEEQVQAVLSQTANHFNVAAATTKRLLLVEDYLESAKFALVAYLATFVGAIMNAKLVALVPQQQTQAAKEE